MLSAIGDTILYDFAKGNLVKDIMHDRLYEIEKKYVSALVAARVFHDTRKKPSMLETRSPSLDTAMSQQPPQLPAPVPAVATVSITSGGDIDTSMSIGEVVERLGLVGNGIGGRVGVRDPSVLLGTGLCFTVSDITIAELNPPAVKLSVKRHRGKWL